MSQDLELRERERCLSHSITPEEAIAWFQRQARFGGLEWRDYFRLADLHPSGAAEYLKTQLLEGELTREALELASWCQHEPADLALRGEERRITLWNDPHRKLDPESFVDMLTGLDQFGFDAFLEGLRTVAIEIVLAWGATSPEAEAPARTFAEGLFRVTPGSEEAHGFWRELHVSLRDLGEASWPRTPVAEKSLAYMVLSTVYLPGAFLAYGASQRMSYQRVYGKFRTRDLPEVMRRLAGLAERLDRVVRRRVIEWAFSHEDLGPRFP